MMKARDADDEDILLPLVLLLWAGYLDALSTIQLMGMI